MSFPENIPGFGIYLALIGLTIGSLEGLVIKLLTEVHSFEIMVIKTVLPLMLASTLALYRQKTLSVPKDDRLVLVVKIIVGNITALSLLTSIRLLSLPDVSSLMSTSNVFTIIFAYFLLREPLTMIKVIVSIVSLIGVVIISQPVFLFGTQDICEPKPMADGDRTVGIALTLFSAIGSSLSHICLRRLKSTPSETLLTWMSLSQIISGTGMLSVIGVWSLPNSGTHWALLLLCSVMSIFSPLFHFNAYKHENAGALALVHSFGIVLSFIWQALVDSSDIQSSSIVGAGIITISVIILTVNKLFEEKSHLFKGFHNIYSYIFPTHYRRVPLIDPEENKGFSL